MCKRLLTLMAVVVATSGLALADNEIDIDQTVKPANATVSQQGSNLSIKIEQIGVSADPITGFVNDAWASQTNFSNAKMDVYQNAGTFNYAWLYQRHGGTSEIKAVQNAGTGDNYLRANQYRWKWNYMDIQQNAGTWNYANLNQAYWNSDIFIDQTAHDYNQANVTQNQNLGNTYIYGADSSGAIADKTPAKQISYSSYNELSINQYDDDKVGLYQEANGYNYADITQYNGGNRLGIYQEAANYNVLDVTQYGDGVVDVTQTSTGGYNYLYISQSFGSSAIVFQTALAGNNTATIIQ